MLVPGVGVCGVYGNCGESATKSRGDSCAALLLPLVPAPGSSLKSKSKSALCLKIDQLLFENCSNDYTKYLAHEPIAQSHLGVFALDGSHALARPGVILPGSCDGVIEP